MSKSITFDRPVKSATPESWVLAKPLVAGEPTKRLTVDVPEPLHHRIKVQCAVQGVNMADVVRELLEQRFAYRLRRVERRYPISWSALSEQFGANIKDGWRFRHSFAEDLAAIRDVFPTLPVEITDQGVILKTCDTERLFSAKGVKLIRA